MIQYLKQNELFINILKSLNPNINISDPFKATLYETVKEREDYSFIEQFFFSSFYYKKILTPFKS